MTIQIENQLPEGVSKGGAYIPYLSNKLPLLSIIDIRKEKA